MSPQESAPTLPDQFPLNSLLRHIAETENQQFCFILGSGASRPSEIPTAAELAKKWLEDLESDLSASKLKVWLLESNIAKVLEGDNLKSWFAKKNLTNQVIAEYYTRIYKKRFAVNRADGYTYLEKIMENVEPSCGYSVLAQVLANTKHNVVITTNFDFLIEDALTTYTTRKPLVCGHESLSGFIKPFSRRPIIAKIHRDLFMDPKNTEEETSVLPSEWITALERIFRFYTPIVIGYGGNDNSLMEVLEITENLENGIYWCYRGVSGEPSHRIKELVKKAKGALVDIEGFDEMMVLLSDKLDYKLLHRQILDIAQKKSESYLQQFGKIQGNHGLKSKDAIDALRKLLKTSEQGWETYLLLAEGENDETRQEEFYLEGQKFFPKNHNLMASYAGYLEDVKKDYKNAEKNYKRAIRLASSKPDYLIDYADFLQFALKDYDKAEKYYKKALRLDGTEASYRINYADFLTDIRSDYNRAQKLYSKALEIDDKNDPRFRVSYAKFLKNIRFDFHQAKKHYERAIELDPEESSYCIYYADFLVEYFKEVNQAEDFYKKALVLNPKAWLNFVSYADFLYHSRHNTVDAEIRYKEALVINPEECRVLINYAIFLVSVHNDIVNAEELYKKAIEFNPTNANVFVEYAKFLQLSLKDNDTADEMYQKALDSEPDNRRTLLAYASFLEDVLQLPDQAMILYEKVAEVEVSNLKAPIV